MKIARKIKEVLKDGKTYTFGEIWQLVNGAEISQDLLSIGTQSERFRNIAGNQFIGRTQVERSVKGLARRGTIEKSNHHPKIYAGDKTYSLATPITYYRKVD